MPRVLGEKLKRKIKSMDSETIFWIVICVIATLGVIVDELRLEMRDED